VLPEFFQRRPAKEPVAIVNLVNNHAWLEHDRMRDHRIMPRVRVLGYVEALLNLATRIGEKRPVCADAGTKLIRLGDVVRANRDQPAIANLEFTVESHKPFMLAAVLGAKASPTENDNHRL